MEALSKQSEDYNWYEDFLSQLREAEPERVCYLKGRKPDEYTEILSFDLEGFYFCAGADNRGQIDVLDATHDDGSDMRLNLRQYAAINKITKPKIQRLLGC